MPAKRGEWKYRAEFLCCPIVQGLKNPVTQLIWRILAGSVPGSAWVLTSECMPFVESRGMVVSLKITILLTQETLFDKKYKKSWKICIRWRDLRVNTAAFKSWSDAACRHPTVWQSLPGTDREDSRADTLGRFRQHSCWGYSISFKYRREKKIV